MILYEGAFYNAKVEFISKERFEKNNWVKYTKHDYTDFNVVHTWFEYINRLLGVLAGFSVLLMFIFSFNNNIFSVNKSRNIIGFYQFIDILYAYIA